MYFCCFFCVAPRAPAGGAVRIINLHYYYYYYYNKKVTGIKGGENGLVF